MIKDIRYTFIRYKNLLCKDHLTESIGLCKIGRTNIYMDEKIIGMYQKGLSAKQTADSLGLGIKKVYNTLERNKVPKRTAAETNAIRFRKTPLSFQTPKQLNVEQKQLQTCALALYWGEGAKKRCVVDLANSDPDVQKIFLRYLREILNIDEGRLRIYLYCFENQEVLNLIEYWIKQLKVPGTQFLKPFVVKGKAYKTHKMPHGLVHVRYNDKRLLEYLLSEIEQLKNLGRLQSGQMLETVNLAP